MSKNRNKKQKTHSNNPHQKAQHQQNNKQNQNNFKNNQGQKNMNQSKPQHPEKKNQHQNQQKGNQQNQPQHQQKKPQPQQQAQQKQQKQQPKQQAPPSQQGKPKEAKKEVEMKMESEQKSLAERIDPNLIQIEEKLNAIEEEYENKLKELWLSIQQKKQPLFQKRRENLKKVDNFWSTVLLSHPQLQDLYEEFDLDALESLTDLYVEFDKSPEDFVITFDFKPNDFFTNSQLKVEVSEDDMEPTVKATKIQWKQGKNPFEQAKSGDKKRKSKDFAGFFSLFNDSTDDVEERAMVLKAIATDVFPDALQYYLEADMDEMDSDEDFDEEIDSNEEMSDDDEEFDMGDDDDEDGDDDEEFDMGGDDDEEDDDDEE